MKKLILMSSVAGAAMIATPAQAQVVDEDETAVANEGEEGGPIVITARRRSESLQDVPLSVTAYSGTQLEREGDVG